MKNPDSKAGFGESHLDIYTAHDRVPMSALACGFLEIDFPHDFNEFTKRVGIAKDS